MSVDGGGGDGGDCVNRNGEFGFRFGGGQEKCLWLVRNMFMVKRGVRMCTYTNIWVDGGKGGGGGGYVAMRMRVVYV